MSAGFTTQRSGAPFVKKGLRPLAARDGAAFDAFAARGFSNPQIVLRWREFSGPVLGRLTAPVSLSPEGLLTISADPSVAILVQHQTRILVQRINLALGSNQVAKIKVISGKFAQIRAPKTSKPLTPSQRQWADQIVSGASDPVLRAALSRLAHAVASESAPSGANAPLRPKS